MKSFLIRVLLYCLGYLQYTDTTNTQTENKPNPEKGLDKLEDVWFRAIVLTNEINRNYIGYEPDGWKREQLVTKLATEYPWLEGNELTKIINGVIG